MKTHSGQTIFLTPILAALTLLSLQVTTSRANTIALDFTTYGGLLHGGNFTGGWDFTLNSDVTVTDLGLWDGPQPGGGTLSDGFADSHIVTIWTSTGTLVASAIIPAGMSGMVVDDFRYVSIAPTPLAAGTYVIGGYFPTNFDYLAAGASGITTAPEVIYGLSRDGSGNAFPSDTDAPSGYFGPNFQFSSTNGAAVPEAGGTFVLLGIALIAMGAFYLRISSRQAADSGCVEARNW